MYQVLYETRPYHQEINRKDNVPLLKRLIVTRQSVDTCRPIQISIDPTSTKNVVYTQSLSKCPGNKRVPVTSLFIFIRKNQVKMLRQKVISWPMRDPKRIVLELLSQVINCLVTKMSCKSETSRKHQESHFFCRSQIIYWLQCLNDVNNLREIYTRGKKNETKSISFNTDLSNLSKAWSTTYQSPSLHTAFLSDWNP